MIQIVLMLFGPGQDTGPIPATRFSATAIPLNAIPLNAVPPRRHMATRPPLHDARKWWQFSGFGLAVAANALGLLIFLASLGMVLRLAEVLLS